jgi:hypothetical protein
MNSCQRRPSAAVRAWTARIGDCWAVFTNTHGVEASCVRIIGLARAMGQREPARAARGPRRTTFVPPMATAAHFASSMPASSWWTAGSRSPTARVRACLRRCRSSTSTATPADRLGGRARLTTCVRSATGRNRLASVPDGRTWPDRVILLCFARIASVSLDKSPQEG